ncbi:Uncharacterised protein [Mycobacteroides abscessus subsp. abscessus]|nr:Uncharacterised protein [Mycobacteroides abscessus subsp. abscessus]
MASAEAGLSDENERYCGGRPVYAANCLASSFNSSAKLRRSAAENSKDLASLLLSVSIRP